MSEQTCTPPQTRKSAHTPQVDILEQADGLVLTLDVPGVKAEDIDIHFERGELVVRGTRHATTPKGRSLVREFEQADYYRAFLISQDVAADRISADLKNGVLTVSLPRAAGASPRRIEVKA